MNDQTVQTTAAPRSGVRFQPPAVPQITLGGFWGQRAAAVCQQTVRILLDRCIEAGMLEQIDPDRPVPEQRIPFHGGLVTAQMFWDSDFGKVIETAAYCHYHRPDPELEARIDGIIDIYGRLQEPDGYLNSWYQRMQPGLRWTNLRDCHELYCAGHLLEGAVAWFQATGKRKLLDIMRRYMDLIATLFGPGEGQIRGYCGHEEIEIGLVRLAELTGERKYLDLAKFFIDERGQQPHFFDAEARAHGRDPRKYLFGTYEYNQSHLPVREQTKVVGHAVRAMYLYSAMADIAARYDDPGLQTALTSLWQDLVGKRLYITGGLGPSAANEGFTTDYDLPNETAYAETCASVALVFWASRMLGVHLDARYGDIMERALYNGAISGLSLDGATFFYENPLESRGTHRRWTWHRCPCCPPNIARLTASVGSYMYGQSDSAIAVHLYGESTARLTLGQGRTVTLTQTTKYPWDGEIAITVSPEAPTAFTLALRIPGWCRNASLTLDGERLDLAGITRDGYASIERSWSPGQILRLSLKMPVERHYANPLVRQDNGRVALSRGPLLYCLEGTDNQAELNQIVVPRASRFTATFEPGLLDGVVTLKAAALADSVQDWNGELYRRQAPVPQPAEIVAVPYFAWDNREGGEMLVWLRDGGEAG